MNRINELFAKKQKNILSVYFTAGFPKLTDTLETIVELEKNGADLIEIGIPFSDPMADGTTIQQSSQKALENGMSLKILFEQIKDVRQTVKIPLIMMGYLNPIYQYGIENFCKKCNEIGIDGLILPDLPMDIYESEYKTIFLQHNLSNIFLITPQTTENRIRLIDSLTNGFIYMVSSAATTGAKTAIANDQEVYFKRIENMKLTNPKLIGFGISNKETFTRACKYANGAIIGSAFIKAVDEQGSLKEKVSTFMKDLIH